MFFFVANVHWCFIADNLNPRILHIQINVVHCHKEPFVSGLVRHSVISTLSRVTIEIKEVEHIFNVDVNFDKFHSLLRNLYIFFIRAITKQLRQR